LFFFDWRLYNLSSLVILCFILPIRHPSINILWCILLPSAHKNQGNDRMYIQMIISIFLNKHLITYWMYFNLKNPFIIFCKVQNKYNVWTLILVWSFVRMNEDEILWWFCRLFMLQINDYISGNKQDKQMLCVYSSFKSTPEVLLAFLLYMCYIVT
jgi:hypothetical protein